MCFHFFYTVQVDTIYQKVLFLFHACFCFYAMEFRKQKNIFCTSEAFLCFTHKTNFCIMNKIKLVWYYLFSRNYFFELSMWSFYIFWKYFYHVRLENMIRILNNFAYFQNIVVCKEPFRQSLLLFWFL